MLMMMMMMTIKVMISVICGVRIAQYSRSVSTHSHLGSGQPHEMSALE